MSGKRPRVARRESERAAKKLVQDKEKLWSLSPGATRERPFEVPSSSVIELRVEALPCPQCGGPLRVREDSAPGPHLRRVEARCQHCTAPRTVWFRIVPDEPN